MNRTTSVRLLSVHRRVAPAAVSVLLLLVPSALRAAMASPEITTDPSAEVAEDENVVPAAFPSEKAMDDEERVRDAHAWIMKALAARHASSVAGRLDGAKMIWLLLDSLSGEAPVQLEFSEMCAEVKTWLSVEDSPWVRHYLLEALVDAHREEDDSVILSYLDGRDPTLTAIAADYAAVRLSPDIEERLSRLEGQQIPWVARRAVAGALASGTSEASLLWLHAALEDPAPEVRAAAAEALRKRADPRSVAPLLAALPSSRSGGKISILNALKELPDVGEIPAIEAETRSSSSWVRAAAASALGAIPGAQPAALVRLLRDDDPFVVLAASRALAGIDSHDAARALVLFLAETESDLANDVLPLMPDAALRDACDSLRNDPGDPHGVGKAVEDLCNPPPAGPAEESETFTAHFGAAPVVQAKGRRIMEIRWVAPSSGDKAEAWRAIPIRENSGSRFMVERGRVVPVRDVIFDGEETWFEVGTDTGSAWIRATDLHRLEQNEDP